jgi:hypothetical protein
MKWLRAFVVAATIATTGCDWCGPEQHAITTSANSLILGGGVSTRQIQYATYRLTEPPATHDAFEFVFNKLEGSTNGEGVALTFAGTDALTQESVTIVLALPVALREGDQYAVGSTFSVEVGAPRIHSQAGISFPTQTGQHWRRISDGRGGVMAVRTSASESNALD